MPRTKAGLRTDTSAGLADLEHRRPEWRAWLRMLERVASPRSAVATESRVTGQRSRVASSTGAPLLHGSTLHLDGRITRLLADLASIAANGELPGGTTLRGFRPTLSDSLSLVVAAVRQDQVELGSRAAQAGVDRGALTSVAHLAALPLLQACGRELETDVPDYWPHGYCPVCAAWPIFAERRGLDRSRRLRCGRCATGWEAEWLRCIYCGEREHKQLGTLEPEQQGELHKVETCSSCQGYLKSIATLGGFSAFELLLQDLETVELDLVALERGFGRPEECGFQLDVEVEG